MVDINKEGFVKIKPRGNELKNYLFYLTFNNRAVTNFYENNIQTNKKFENTENLILDKGNLNLYYSYIKSTKSELKGHRVKALECIMSYSTDFNRLMIKIYGLEKWKKIYNNIIEQLLKKHFKNNRAFLSYIHTYDSQGLRIHNHTLIYPYKYNLKTGIFEVYNYIPDEDLNKLKIEYNKISKELLKRNINKVMALKQHKKYKKYISNLQTPKMS